MTESQLCPRRYEDGATYGTPDIWQNRSGRHACSYCGSLHPDEFMELVRTGAAELGPTDKNYKVYISGANAGDGGKFYFQHLSKEQRREFVDLYNERPVREYAEDLSFEVSDEGTSKMLIGYPGYFYNGVFFMTGK